MSEMTNNSECPNQTKLHKIDAVPIIAVVIAILSLLIRQFNDADTWWHITIGNSILETLSIPHVDIFTAAGSGRPYHDSHWLFQVLVATANRMGGTVAVGLVPVSVWGSTFFFSYLSMRKYVSPAIASFLLFILAIACNARFIPRPDIITCLMISVFYYKLQTGRYTTSAQLFLLGLLQIVWSNAHGLFVIGPFMGFSYLLGAVHEKTFQRNPVDLKPAIKLFSVLIFTSFCTPFGLNGWRYAVQIALEAGPNALFIYKDLEELKPVFSSNALMNPDYWAFYLLVATAVIMTLPILTGKKISVDRLIIISALFVAACSGRRNMPLFAIASAPFIAESASRLFTKVVVSKKNMLIISGIISVFSLLPLSGAYYRWFNYSPLGFGFGAPHKFQPAGIPGFLQQINFKGQIYNNDLFGGYLMYHGITPLIDGRWELYDQDELVTILNAPFDQLSWQWVVNRYNIRGVLLRHGEGGTKAFVMRFLTDGSFKAVYQDDVSAFWVKTDFSNQGLETQFKK